MAISSNTLFNFMKEYKYLVQALQYGFWPRYSIEPYWRNKHFAIPMLCFCDIPLSQIKEHIDNYGSYGIGVTKEFARKHKITPVIYIESSSKTMSKLMYFLDDFHSPNNNIKGMKFEEYMLYYAKKVNGKDKNSRETKFYNEREWRYIPSISSDVHLEIYNDLNEANLKSLELSEKTKNSRIGLNLNDIKYLFVKNESDKNNLCKEINKLYGNNFKDKDLDALKTKIQIVDQIREDL